MSRNKFTDGDGPSQRQLRVGETIRRALSEILARDDIHDPELNRLSITIGEVRTTGDLKIATAFVMPLGGGNVDDAVALLARNKYELRRMIGRKLKLKFTPDLRFRPDDTFDLLDESRRLFSDETVRRDIAAGQSGEDQVSDDQAEDTSAGPDSEGPESHKEE
nr:30S ribosome-binding factor RbfA [Pseudooceanicola algae]